MIKHIVMWNVRGETPAEKDRAIAAVREAFEGLRGRVAGLRHLEIGVDASRVPYACDVVLYSEFESAQALRDYADHPAHLLARERVGDLRTARYQVDYSVEVAP